MSNLVDLTQPKYILSDADFEDDASRLGCHPILIRVVAQVESAGGGFCPDGFPKTLFEGHYFSRFTKGKFDTSHPSLSYPKWTKKHYGRTWQEERARLDQAVKLDRTAALMSASWGMFQIMGSNFAACGFKTVQQFVTAMCRSANDQLAAFTSYIIENGLADELKEARWSDFARHYNGPGQVVVYANRMAAAYDKLRSRN